INPLIVFRLPVPQIPNFRSWILVGRPQKGLAEAAATSRFATGATVWTQLVPEGRGRTTRPGFNPWHPHPAQSLLRKPIPAQRGGESLCDLSTARFPIFVTIDVLYLDNSFSLIAPPSPFSC